MAVDHHGYLLHLYCPQRMRSRKQSRVNECLAIIHRARSLHDNDMKIAQVQRRAMLLAKNVSDVLSKRAGEA